MIRSKSSYSEEESSLKLVMLGDLHYPIMQHATDPLRTTRNAFFSEILRQFASMDADYYISLGDLTNEGLPEELSDVMELLKPLNSEGNFIHVLGNHDTYSIPKKDILAITEQQRYSSIDTEEAIFLFLDSTKEMKRDDWGGELDIEQLTWLEQKVVQSGSKPLFICCHHPLYDTTTGSTAEMMYTQPATKIWSILEKKVGKGFFFNGHNHSNSIVARGQWHFIQTAACLDVPAFRTMQLVNGKVEIRLSLLNNPELLDNAKLVGENMVYFRPKAQSIGSEADWSLTIDLTAFS